MKLLGLIIRTLLLMTTLGNLVIREYFTVIYFELLIYV